VPDSLALLLAEGERAAFRAAPASGIAVLQQAVVEGREAERDAEAALAAWLLGVCLSSSGRWGSALTVMEALLVEPAPGDGDDAVGPEQRLVASLAASTTASVHRQIGRHDVARAYDEQALTWAAGSAEAAFDAYVGLAADAVGAGDAGGAREAFDAAQTCAHGRSDWWRQLVRLDWAAAEIALLDGDANAAAMHASAALGRAESSGAPRHVAKSLLFLGVALLERQEIDEATATLRRAGSLAESLGTLPVLWPAKALLGALTSSIDPAESAASMAAARAAIATIAADLPSELRAEWLARDDVSALSD
jgi:tetratricopeptide (TPR) repeat protein